MLPVYDLFIVYFIDAMLVNANDVTMFIYAGRQTGVGKELTST